MQNLYSTPLWKTVRSRALARDGHRCTVARLLGGPCSAADVPLEVHHILPVEVGGAAFDLENLGTTCKAHHPQWEALRRILVLRQLRPAPRCPHQHRTAEARDQCERRLARLYRRRQLVA
jgi:hypothetical protein